MDNNYIPKPASPITGRIPINLPDYTKPVFTPKNSNGIPDFKQEIDQIVNEFVNQDQEWYDEPDYTQAVAQGMRDILDDGRPKLTRSEAEEQMHLTELRRQAEGYDENDAIVISQVLAKRYPMAMFAALNDEYFQMKSTVDKITGAIGENAQQ